jgi:short-subunit dehydrogenase
MKDKLVLVTGASSGIGRSTVELFAKRGARPLLLARNTAALEDVVRAIAHGGGRASAYPVDLSDPDATRAISDQIKAEQGVPDVIVNNAGAGRWLPLVETSPDEARRMIEVPYLAAFTLTRLFLPDMMARGSGQLGFVTSPASYIVWPNACAYIAARHALKGLAEALRTEMRGTGIDISLIVLGLVASEYWEHNPGSLANVPPPIPFLTPELTTEQAAETIVSAIEHRKKRITRPWIYSVLAKLA